MSLFSQGMNDIGLGLGGAEPTNSYNSNVQDPNAAANNSVYNNEVGQGNTLDTGAAAGQNQLIAALQNQAAGNGPSMAAMQYQQASQAQQGMNAGQQAAQMGVSPGLAQAQLARQNAAVQQGTAAGSAETALQQQLAAQNQLAQLLNTSRGQDINQTLGAQGNQLTGNEQQLQAGLGNSQINAGVAQQNTGIQGGLEGGLLSGAASVMGAGLSAGGAGAGGAGGAGAAAAAADGAVVPGVDAGKDTQGPYMLRPREVVVAPESPVYNAALLDAMKRGVQAKPVPVPGAMQQPAQDPHASLLDAILRRLRGGPAASPMVGVSTGASDNPSDFAPGAPGSYHRTAPVFSSDASVGG